MVRIRLKAGCAVGFASGFPALLLAAATIAACSPPEERVARRVARAEELVREQREGDALLELESALVVDPRSAGTAHPPCSTRSVGSITNAASMPMR